VSTQNCPVCAQPIDDDFNAVIVGPALRGIANWDVWATAGETLLNGGRNNHWTNLVRDVTYRGHEVVIEQVATKPAGVSMTEWDESYPQGTTFDAYVLFRINGRFYRATGEGDSYGDITWHPHLQEVKVKTKTIEVYEVVG
jgi:hypothetical protein